MSPIQILFSGNRTTAIVKWRIKINSMIIPLFYLLECNRIHYLLVFHGQLLTRPCEVPTSTCTFVYRNTCELPSSIIKINSFCLYYDSWTTNLIFTCVYRDNVNLGSMGFLKFVFKICNELTPPDKLMCSTLLGTISVYIITVSFIGGNKLKTKA